MGGDGGSAEAVGVGFDGRGEFDAWAEHLSPARDIGGEAVEIDDKLAKWWHRFGVYEYGVK